MQKYGQDIIFMKNAQSFESQKREERHGWIKKGGDERREASFGEKSSNRMFRGMTSARLPQQSIQNPTNKRHPIELQWNRWTKRFEIIKKFLGERSDKQPDANIQIYVYYSRVKTA